MVRLFRMRRYNAKNPNGKFDFLYPQAITNNIIRHEDGGVLEEDLLRYDRHLAERTNHLNRALSGGTAKALFVQLKNTALVDGLNLLITLHCNLEAEPTLSFNGSEPYPIVAGSGDRIPGGQAEGSVILVVWSEANRNWCLLSSDSYSDVTKIVLPVESEYVYTALADGEKTITIPGFDKKSCKLTVNYAQTVLRHDIDFRYIPESNNTIELIDFALSEGEHLFFTIISYITTAKQGHFRYDLVDTEYPVTIEEDHTTVVRVPKESLDAHSVVINYQQTILRNNLDYVYSEDRSTIELQGFELSAGEVLVFRVTNFVEAPGELVPNNWGATGNYRYSLNVVHGSYVATEDNVSIFPVPNFNPRRDDIAIIDDNKLYIYDVDYTIDEIGNVVLLKRKLNTGEEIFFTILQGAMMDVPNFNVISDSGQDGQHLLVNISYSILTDYYTLLVRLTHDLLTAPTIKCVDGPAEAICDCYGCPILGGYKKGAYLWLVYSEPEHKWYSLSHGQIDISRLVPQNLVASGTASFLGQKDVQAGEFNEAVIAHGLGVKPKTIDIVPCEPPTILEDGTKTEIGDIWSYADETYLYVGNSGWSTSKFNWNITTEDATNDLRGYLEEEILSWRKKPGNIIPHHSLFVASHHETVHVADIENFRAGIDKIIVNLNQTILQPEVDYVIDEVDNGITLQRFSLEPGDILQFTVLEQEDFS